ncbi:tRNA methyltransferase [Metallosphaera hakonensis]|uniref:tRNA (cytidine(56)-2'-O)-methyltransferase n=1 Tax=Metallosphaera hakonensis JCM 8857 = DSM 7519 TaxID=1293036 RepID=A0A2U9IU10_9CREN|nr:tRNA methyltransferase [Metallosphaera hakonensis]AWR99462.1 tRNA methyltransferase [Metallosphaera hakonensis JCM 8857 = DSM 7519]
MKNIFVLRLGHRPLRDKRVTTHVALVARAFGAKGIYVDGKDQKLVEKIKDVISLWGGSYFQVETIADPKKLVKTWKAKGGTIIHLTMYGINLPQVQDRVQHLDNILVVVGAEKVEGWYYHMADINVAVSNQPHSEVAALAIFLDRLYKGEELNIMFGDSKIKVIPMERGKKVIRSDNG